MNKQTTYILAEALHRWAEDISHEVETQDKSLDDLIKRESIRGHNPAEDAHAIVDNIRQQAEEADKLKAALDDLMTGEVHREVESHVAGYIERNVSSVNATHRRAKTRAQEFAFALPPAKTKWLVAFEADETRRASYLSRQSDVEKNEIYHTIGLNKNQAMVFDSDAKASEVADMLTGPGKATIEAIQSIR